MTFDRIKVQLQALGLMTPGTRRRPVSDDNTYWKLTPYGEKHLLQLKAIRRKGTQVVISEATVPEGGHVQLGAGLSPDSSAVK